MQDSEYDTVVRSLGGDAQLRRVSAVHEWRVERELGSDRLVLSITTGPGMVCSFLVDNVDALDIAEVLHRRTRPSAFAAGPEPSLPLER
jgi:hypothetical protein